MYLLQHTFFIASFITYKVFYVLLPTKENTKKDEYLRF